MAEAHRGTCRGFSMVELILALLIVGVLAAVAVPRLVDRGAFQTRGAAAETRAALRYAQKLAMAKNREVCVTVTATTVTLMLNPTQIAGAACITPVSRPGEGADYVLTLPAGVALTPALAFRFDGLGRPVTIPANTNVNLTLGGSLAVTVLRETGYVQ